MLRVVECNPWRSGPHTIDPCFLSKKMSLVEPVEGMSRVPCINYLHYNRDLSAVLGIGLPANKSSQPVDSIARSIFKALSAQRQHARSKGSMGLLEKKGLTSARWISCQVVPKMRRVLLLRPRYISIWGYVIVFSSQWQVYTELWSL